ncbi:MAG: hypothetical protein M3070_10815 [Actinomycetota bacterium]|nr:hypothetical protein [Actinomycetota bacterium]
MTCTKSYGDTRALSGVSLGVGPGEMVGFVGSNGAGTARHVFARRRARRHRPDRERGRPCQATDHGVGVLFSSYQLELVERLCERW